MGRKIRIVVGEGRTAQQGLLRFVLEGEGFDVVGEARSPAEVATEIADKEPDVVVLDDGIGVMAVSLVREVAPRSKIVLVWPSAVVPIGGDARVEPAKILKELGPAVRHLAPIGVGAGVTETFQRPEWIDRVRKDPATLRDKLDAVGTEPSKRPSVTQLQRRGRRLHPGRKAASEEPRETERTAAVVPLPLATGEAAAAETAADTDAADTGPAETPSEWNRRLGTLALSGAAAVSALVLAVALGGSRVTPSIVRGDDRVPPNVRDFIGGAPGGPFVGGDLGDRGWPFPPIVEAEPPLVETDEPPAETTDDVPDGGFLGPIGPDEPEEETPPPDDGDGGGGGDGDGGDGDGGGGNGGSRAPDGAMPGYSSAHNPFGGPPSKLGLTPAGGAGLGATIEREHGKSAQAHAHKN